MPGRNALLVAAAAVLVAIPLFMGFEGEDVFGGADDAAKDMITTIRPDYTPWLEPLWEPPSAEVASLLFALQAALGAGFLGYYFGLRRGQGQHRDRARER